MPWTFCVFPCVRGVLKFTGQRNLAEVPSLLRTYAKSCLIDCIIVKGETSDPCGIPSHQIIAINYTPFLRVYRKAPVHPACTRAKSFFLFNAKLHQIRSLGIHLPERQWKAFGLMAPFLLWQFSFFFFFLFVHESKLPVMIADIKCSEVKTISRFIVLYLILCV